MSFVENILTPIIQMCVYAFMIGGLLTLIFFGFLKLYKKYRFFIKYRIFGYNYKIDDVEWCLEAIEKGYSEVDIKKLLLIKGEKEKKVAEIIYIYNKLLKKLKGGNINGR